jgi:hypothetical protein
MKFPSTTTFTPRIASAAFVFADRNVALKVVGRTIFP